MAAPSKNVRSPDVLFRPYRRDHISFPNRLVMAPMTREKAPNGILGADNLAYYERRAAADFGLLISEGTWIDHPVAAHRKTVPRFYGDDALFRWKTIIDAVHAVGAKMVPQLWHVGTSRRGNDLPNPHLPSMGPSGIAFSDVGVSTAYEAAPPMTERDISSCIDAYAKAAEDAYRLGFDGIELHAAHGYLIDQFFWKVTNQRTDFYNGSIRNRARFAVEIVRECRKRTHPLFPIGLRFSQWKQVDYSACVAENPGELAEFLEPLVDAGVDIFHCSTRRYWQPAFEGSELSLAGWTKKLSGKTTIAVGCVGLDKEHQTSLIEMKQGYETKASSIDRLLDMMEREEFDLIAVGRAALADYAWAQKIRNHAWDELIPYSTAIRGVLY